VICCKNASRSRLTREKGIQPKERSRSQVGFAPRICRRIRVNGVSREAIGSLFNADREDRARAGRGATGTGSLRHTECIACRYRCQSDGWAVRRHHARGPQTLQLTVSSRHAIRADGRGQARTELVVMSGWSDGQRVSAAVFGPEPVIATPPRIPPPARTRCRLKSR